MIKKVRQPVGDSKLRIENIGPITEAVVEFDPSGDLVEIIGPNGSGKSTLLNAIAAAQGRKVKLTRRDGVKGPGVFEGFGRTVSVNSRQMVDGELTVPVLDEDYSMNDVINPREVNPVAADGRIIRTILRLAKAEAKPELFHDLIGVEEFNKLVDPESLKTDDVVQMAKAIKRDIDKEALSIERKAAAHSTEALALEKALEGIEFDETADLAEIRKEHETAVTEAANLANQLKAYLEAVAESDQLSLKVKEAEAAVSVPMAELEQEVKKHQDAAKECEEEISGVDYQIAELQRKRERLTSDMTVAVERAAASQARVIAAKESSDKLATLKEGLAKAQAVPEVTQAQVVAANENVETLRKKMTAADLQGLNAEKAKRRNEERAKARTLEKQAERLRNAAKGTDNVLSELIGKLGESIYVGSDEKDNVRLMTKHQRGEIFFLDLSKGERMSLIVKLQIKAVGPGGSFDADQELYEGLDPANREAFYNELKGTGVVAFVAQCSDGELRSRSWSLERSAVPATV